jgi:plasmid stabilization system protein ParE
VIYIFHPEGRVEFLAAIDYYEAREPGMGYDFAVEVHSTIQSILSFPNAWPVLELDIRRCLVSRFPYGILYAQEQDRVLIVAVMHLHRDPNYWKHRVE